MKTLRFLTLMLTALSLSAAFAHLLEMPAKLGYDGPLWLHLLQTLYPTYGKVSGVCEIAAVLAAWVLVFVLRPRPRAMRWTLLGAIGLTLAHAVFWIWIAPVNAELVPLSAQSLPAHWSALRDQWEYAHAARAVVELVVLAALLVSVLVELPDDGRHPRAAR